MAKTYLQVVQDFVSEVGVAGSSGPDTIALGKDSVGINRVIQYVRDAHRYVCDLWPDWRFLWTRENATIPASMVSGSDTVLPVADPTPRAYVFDSFHIKRNGRWHRVHYMPWHHFRERYERGDDPRDASDHPPYWTVTPDDKIQLSNPPATEYDYKYEYYQWAADLENDSDPIIVPFWRMVLCRAKMIYAERENAPEIMHGAAAEYSDLSDRLEANFLVGNAGGRGHEELGVNLNE